MHPVVALAPPDAFVARSRATRRTLFVAAALACAALGARVEHAFTLARLARGHIALRAVERSDALAVAASFVDLVALLAAVVALAGWSGALIARADALGLRGLAKHASRARWSWFVPVAHLVLPAWILARTARVLRDGALPEPASRARSDGTADYRTNAIDAPSPPVRGPRPSVAGFWCAWVLARLMATVADALALRSDGAPDALVRACVLDVAAGACALVALLLAARVVRGFDAALREHARRRDGDRVSLAAPAAVTS